MHERRIFDGAFLRATLFRGGSEKLFVSFRQRLGQDGAFDDPKPSMKFIKEGYAHLHLQSRFNDWYINRETEALETRLSELKSYGRRVGIGFSMGGYAAMRFAPVLRLQHLIAVLAQFTIDPALVPQDRRYRRHAAGFDPVLGRIDENRALKGALLFDPAHALDKLHAQELKLLCPNMELVPVWGGGHPATGVIGSMKRFPRVQQQLVSGTVNSAALRALHRECRRNSPLYWTHLAQAAQTAGRRDLAHNALVMAEQLTQSGEKS
ncbi:MAG: alpha/beta hydrolase [Planktotalea sp.]|uniref:alpha/beta hydrolase n=1 Tax=Planktotalea sp. TaxID=2029877 RepID=UPI003C76D60D